MLLFNIAQTEKTGNLLLKTAGKMKVILAKNTMQLFL